jgi:hypothetical protein
MQASATCSEPAQALTRTRTRARAALCAAMPVVLFAAVAICATWPMTARIGSALPRGNLSNGALQFFDLWTLEWNADRIGHGFADYWHAPIFYPEPHAFAFSEPMALTGAAFALLAAAFGQVAGYNLTLLLFFVLNGVAARRLLRVSGVSPLTATAGGVLAVILPFALKEIGVLQLTALFPTLFALAELCLLFSAPRSAALVRLAIWFTAALWTCVYYALFLTVFAALGLALAWSRAWLRRPAVLGALAGLAIVCGAAAPIALVQRPAIARFARSDKSIERGSATVGNYLALPPRSLLARAGALPAHSRSLYPGVVLCGLALTGLIGGLRGPHRRWLLFCAAGAVLAVLLSFGTRLELFGVRPYALTLQRYWPGFAQLRSPYRFAGFAQILLLPLAGLGLERLSRTPFARRGQLHALALLVAVVVAAAIEILPLGHKLARFPHAALHEPWIAWLAARPDGVVAMAPPEASGKLVAFEPTTLAMLQGLRHGHPLLNGYSGFFPRRSRQLMRSLRAFPEESSIAALRGAGVRFVVVERAWLAGRNAWQQIDSTALHAVHQDRLRVIYELAPP